MSKLPLDLCCGCAACCSICPTSAIQMLPNQEGFLYPDVDMNKCVTCGLCESVCPILCKPAVSETYTRCVVARNVNEDVVEQSTSGGFVDALVTYVLKEKNGYAAGVIYDEQFLPTHILTNSSDVAAGFRNSKYAQSSINTVFLEIRERLYSGDHVLFVGTPCQVAGLKSFLRKEYENLLTVDLVCRSIPSPKLWRKYLDWQEHKHRAKVKSVTCRKKTYGYHSGALEIAFDNGKHYAGSNRVDLYMKSFHHDICSRHSCYECQFKTKHRCSDFTVFDSWHPQLVTVEPMQDDDRGYSNVLVHTPKGKGVLDSMENIWCIDADAEKMFEFTGGMESKSIVLPEARRLFYSTLEADGFEHGVKQYIKVTALDRFIEGLKPVRMIMRKKFSKMNSFNGK